MIGDWLLCSKLPSLTPFPSARRGGLNKPKGKKPNDSFAFATTPYKQVCVRSNKNKRHRFLDASLPFGL